MRRSAWYLVLLGLVGILLGVLVGVALSQVPYVNEAGTNPLERYFDAPLDFKPPPGTYQFLRRPPEHHLYLHVLPGQGAVTGTPDKDGRTGIAGLYVLVDHDGQGDAGGITVFCRVSGGTAPPLTTANPACVLLNGQVDAYAENVYLNPMELQLHDNGYANVSGSSFVSNYHRNSRRGPGSNAFANGVRIQSIGTVPLDAIYAGYGLTDAGIDLTDFTITNHQGIVLRGGDRVYYDARPGFTYSKNPGGTWTGVHEGGLTTVVEGQPILQLRDDLVVVGADVAIRGTVILLDQDRSGVVCAAWGMLYISPTGRC